MKNKYSLVVLTYNQENTVKEAVYAALNQRCEPLEILVSDDCSSDQTFQIITDLVTKYTGQHKIVVNQNPQNLGLIEHINYIHELASGDVIIVAAGDDISLPNRCQKIISIFEEKQPLLVCSHARVIDKDGNTEESGYLSASLYNQVSVKVAASSPALYLGATGAWHRNLYSKYGPIAKGAYEDLVLGFRAVLEDKYYVIKDELVTYRLGYGITSSPFKMRTEADFLRDRLDQFIVMCAVLCQRRKDAVTFGHHQNSEIISEIDKKIKYFKIRASYYNTDRHAFRINLCQHPILAIKCILSEKNRLRKFRHRRKMRLKP